jgi:hypothetical protein
VTRQFPKCQAVRVGERGRANRTTRGGMHGRRGSIEVQDA